MKWRLHPASAAVLFLLGAIGVPTLHLVYHELPHEHRSAAIHYGIATPTDAVELHQHDGEAPHAHDIETEHGEAPSTPVDHHDDDHGSRSSAHFDVALSESAAAIGSDAFTLLVQPDLVGTPCSSAPLPCDEAVRFLRGPPRSA